MKMLVPTQLEVLAAVKLGAGTYEEIAEELGISVAAVERRTTRLRSNGLLTWYGQALILSPQGDAELWSNAT